MERKCMCVCAIVSDTSKELNIQIDKETERRMDKGFFFWIHVTK